MRRQTLVFLLIAVLSFLAAKFLQKSSFLWAICFASTIAIGLYFMFFAISQLSFAQSKLKQFEKQNAASNDFNEWLYERLFGIQIGEAKIGLWIISIPIVMLCYQYIQWQTETVVGHAFRFIAYSIIGLIPSVLVYMGIGRAQKKLSEAVEASSSLSESWRAWKSTKVTEALDQLLREKMDSKQVLLMHQLKDFGIVSLRPTMDLLHKSEGPQKLILSRAVHFIASVDYSTEEDRKDVVQALMELLKSTDRSILFGALKRINQVDNIWMTDPQAKQLMPHLTKIYSEMLQTNLVRGADANISPQDEVNRKMLEETLDMMDESWRQSPVAKEFAVQLLRGLAPPSTPSIGDLLTASIGNIHRQSQEAFVACLQQLVPGIRDPLSVRDSISPGSNITWNNSQELRDASNAAVNSQTRDVGIAKLEALCEAHPSSSAPYALLAQAIEQNHQHAKAELLLLDAIPRVHTKSEIMDMLGNLAKNEGDHRKATAYYFISAYAMNPDSTDWGTMVYLSGVFRAVGSEERAAQCDEAATRMRNGNRVELTPETSAAIAEAIRQNGILVDLANNAWPSIVDNIGRLSGKYGKETWKPGAAPVVTDQDPIRQQAMEMLNDFDVRLDSLLQRAIQAKIQPDLSLNLATASIDEKMKLATSYAAAEPQFRNEFLAIIDAVKTDAESISSALETKPEIEITPAPVAQTKIEAAESITTEKAEKNTGFCQMCGKPDVAFQRIPDTNRRVYLCSKTCLNRYGTTRAEAVNFRQVNAVIDTTGTGIAEALHLRRKEAYESKCYCWFCGKTKKMGEDDCPHCSREADPAS